jgi:enamine deaminase RidA (YjgF/YER057c/UK114 family)
VIDHFPHPAGLAPGNGFSHVTSATGRIVAVSGQLPVDASGTLVSHDPLTQARQVFANIGAALAAVGAVPADILRLNFYVLDLTDLPVVRTARDEFVDTANPPASSLVQVAGLVLPGARLEIDALVVMSTTD